MEFEWDEDKAASNLRKHGISFDFATAAFADDFRYERAATEIDHGEARFSVTALVGQIEIIVVFTERGELTRLISARKVTEDERRYYWQNRSL